MPHILVIATNICHAFGDCTKCLTVRLVCTGTTMKKPATGLILANAKILVAILEVKESSGFIGLLISILSFYIREN